MIKIIAGGKKNAGWVLEACAEYEKRLRKPFDVVWNFMPEDKLDKYLSEWPFTGREFIVILKHLGLNGKYIIT